MHILVVDDDHIRQVIRFALQKAGYEVSEAEDGKAALLKFAQCQPDLVVLDVMMPELDGTEVCRQLRIHHSTPIIFLTAKDDEVDIVVGLELGGDDYMVKPFSPRQLVARVKAILRRCVPAAERQKKDHDAEVKVGNLQLNLESYAVFWRETALDFTATEFRLLAVLARRPSKVFSREELIQLAYDNVVVSDRTIDSHIRRVRKKIVEAGGEAIETHHGFGYRLGLCL